MRAAALALLTAACAAPPAPGPAARFESGGGTVLPAPVDRGAAAALAGVWIGPYRALDPAGGAPGGRDAGTARLELQAAGDGNQLRGAITWTPEGAPPRSRLVIGALTLHGDFLILNAQGSRFVQDGVTFLEIDLPPAEGAPHRHRLVRQP